MTRTVIVSLALLSTAITVADIVSDSDEARGTMAAAHSATADQAANAEDFAPAAQRDEAGSRQEERLATTSDRAPGRQSGASGPAVRTFGLASLAVEMDGATDVNPQRKWSSTQDRLRHQIASSATFGR